jgi:hypothetical protein
LGPDTLLVRKAQDRAEGPATHWEQRTPDEDRAARGEGIPDEAIRSDQSNAPAAVRSPAANRNHARRNAKSVGSLRVAQRQPLEEWAVVGHTGKAQPAGAEMSRRGTGGTVGPGTIMTCRGGAAGGAAIPYWGCPTIGGG